jgi:hypothetical protein
MRRNQKPVVQTMPVRPVDANAELDSITVATPPGDAEISLIAYSGDLSSEAARVKLT